MQPFLGKKFLITGSTGQLGYELVQILVANGLNVVTSSPDSRSPFPGIAHHPMDLTDQDSINQTMARVRPDILIHPAAYTQVDRAESESELAHRINADAVACLATNIKQSGGVMLHFSTDYVYGGTGCTPLQELDKKNPPNAYARSKLAGELVLQESEIPFLCFRTSWVYGIAGNNFPKTMLKLGKERENLRVINDQFGAPTSAKSLAHAIWAVLMKIQTRTPAEVREHFSGFYNLCNSGTTHWHEIAETVFAFARELGIELRVHAVEAIPTQEYPTPAVRPLNSRLDISKFIKTFDHRPADWQQALSLYLTELSAGKQI